MGEAGLKKVTQKLRGGSRRYSEKSDGDRKLMDGQVNVLCARKQLGELELKKPVKRETIKHF